MPNLSSSFLVINPFGIGDVLFSTPLMRNLKNYFPDSKIFYLCNRRTYPILNNHPFIERAFIYERDEFEAIRRRSKIEWFKMFASFIGEIKRERIDVALDLSLNTQFGFLAWGAGIRKRIGLDYKKRGLFLTHRFPIEGFEGKYVAECYLDLLTVFGFTPVRCPLEVYTDSSSRMWAKEFIKRHDLASSLIIGIAPFGGEAFGPNAGIKRWPPDKFAHLIKRLVREMNAKIFIFAGPKEKDDLKNLLEAVGETSSACYEFSDASLERVIAAIEYCPLMVANDTGPLRFADALGKKVVGLFGPVDESVYGPYPPDPLRTAVISKDIPCRPCYRKFRLSPCLADKRCLREIDVEHVFDAVKKLIAGGGTQP